MSLVPKQSEQESTRERLDLLLHSILNRREIHDIKDVIEAIGSVAPPGSFLAVIFYQPKMLPSTAGADVEGDSLLFNYASFALDNGRVLRFENRFDLAAFARGIQGRADLLSLRTDLCSIFYSRHFANEMISAIQTVCTTYYVTSDPYAHYIENTSRRIARHFFPNSSETQDLPAIAEFIANRFDVKTAFIAARDPIGLKLHGATIADFSIQLSDSALTEVLSEANFIHDLITSIRVGNDYSGLLKSGSVSLYYKLIPVSIQSKIYTLASVPVSKRNEQQKYFPIGAFVIVSINKKVDRICYTTARELVREVVGTKKIAEQLRSINDLHQQILGARDRLTNSPFVSQSEATNDFSRYAQAVASSIVRLTSAHSATVRLYDPFRGALRPIAAEFSRSLSGESRAANDISVGTNPRSVNAFVFSEAENGTVYIPYVDQVPPELSAKGLASVLLTRKETKSELCIRLSKNTVPIGTLNIEAPYAYALGKELLYCQASARLLSEYYDLAMKTSDSGWLPKISMSHIVYHRIQKVRRERPDIETILNFIENPLQRANAKRELSGTEELSEIVRSVASSAANITDRQFKNLVRYNIGTDLNVRSEAAASVAIILETLIENCLTHANVDKDKIVIALSKGSIALTRNVEKVTQEQLQLRISYEARLARTQLDLLDRLTVAPVWEDEDQSYHFGMFLLGAHARLLGGVTYVDSDAREGRTSRPLRVIVVLPLPLSVSPG